MTRAAATLVLVLGACAPGPEPAARRRVIVRLEASEERGALTDRAHLGRELLERSTRRLAPLRSWLLDRGQGPGLALPTIGGLAIEVPDELLEALRIFPGVELVEEDLAVPLPRVDRGYPIGPGWNLDLVGARAAWQQGFDGTGVVIASMDTGVDVGHPDLAARFRGGAGDWFDPVSHSSRPFDRIGHGTQMTAVIVGGDASGAAIGVAPGARFIAARVYDDRGESRPSLMHAAFGWLLDPDGDPSTDDAPDVVNASWGSSAAGACEHTFEHDLELLRTAGIVVVFAAGNSGPAAASSVSPANLPGALSAGAIDSQRLVAHSSSRGPSACTQGLYPTVVAPGVGVRTADVSLPGSPAWVAVSGSSVAAAHVSGVAALLRQAQPLATPAAIEEALRLGAADLGAGGPDFETGYGLVDARGALSRLGTQGAP